MTTPRDGTIDELNLTTAGELIEAKNSGKKIIATCPTDDEPLISTLEFPKAEFYCQVCGTKYGFLSPKPAEWTQELQDRHDALRTQYEADRAERQQPQR